MGGASEVSSFAIEALMVAVSHLTSLLELLGLSMC